LSNHQLNVIAPAPTGSPKVELKIVRRSQT
jgi:hypothetical protein